MTPAKRLRAALYGRVSLNMHGNSRSPGQQHSAGEQACADEGWINAGAYGTGDGSASRLTTKQRAEWARLLDDIAAGRIDVVIVWEWSRADRTLTTGSAFLDLCRKHGVLIHVVTDERTYDVARRAKDWEILAKGLVDNAMEVERTSQRSRRDRAARVEQGIVDGKIAYGYRRIYDSNTRRFIRQEADPATAPIVREIIERIVAGVPITVLAADLSTRGIPTPKGETTWCRSTVRAIALNPAYIARRRVDGKLWPVDWPALVSEASHYAAVRLLTDSKRKTTRPGRAVHLLSYIALCGECDGPMQTMTRGKNRDGSRRQMYCCGVSQCSAITVTKLDEEVRVRLCRYLARPEIHQKLTRVDGAAEEAIKDEIGALQGKRQWWRDQTGTGVDDETIADAVRKLNAAIEDAKTRRAAMNTASGAVRALIGDGEVKPYEALLATWEDDLGVAQRREIVRELLSVKVGRLKASREPGVGVSAPRGKRIEIEPLTAR